MNNVTVSQSTDRLSKSNRCDCSKKVCRQELGHIRSDAQDGGPTDAAKLIEARAVALIDQHPHFRGRSQFVGIKLVDGTLVLSGQLPSFYLKQLAQEALKALDNVRIDNQIDVASPTGEDLEHIRSDVESPDTASN